jgi:uncharacterized Zn finger protein (UPF0148 family)
MTCGVCEGTTSDGIHLCPGCRDKLTDNLRRVESTVEAVWTSAARQNVGTGSVGTSGHAAPADPSNSRAYDTGRTLNTILTGWARALGHTQPHAVKAANVLLQHIREVREADWAPVLHQELAEALTDCDRATDRAAPRIFAGICPTEEDGQECGTPVYTPEGRTEARCQTCGATWDLTDWRERALTAAGPATATARELSRILSDPIRSLTFPENKVAGWLSRRKLRPIGYREDGRAVYQVRKVRRLWERSLIESAVRSARMIDAKIKREQAELDAAKEAQNARMARRAA